MNFREFLESEETNIENVVLELLSKYRFIYDIKSFTSQLYRHIRGNRDLGNIIDDQLTNIQLEKEKEYRKIILKMAK